MTSNATTPDQYFKDLPADRKDAMIKIRNIILENLPKGYKEIMSYGMPGYVVPHEIYAAGYHCDPKLPLPFIAVASQKNFIAFYHMGIYAIPELLTWFTTEFPKHSNAKLDMGKACLRFKKPEHIPYKLLGQLVKKVPVKEWIKVYEENIKR
jgi:hypothetical protein